MFEISLDAKYISPGDIALFNTFNPINNYIPIKITFNIIYIITIIIRLLKNTIIHQNICNENNKNCISIPKINRIFIIKFGNQLTDC